MRDHYSYPKPVCHSPQYGRRVVRATGRAGFATVKVGFRHRNKLAPAFVAAGLAIASTVLHIVDAATGWQTALVIAVLLALLLGGKQWFARRREEPWPVSSLVQSWLALTSAAGWTAVAASMAPWSVPMPGLLAAGYLVSQAAWLWHHRERPEVVMEPVEVFEDVDPRVFTWVTAVSADGGALPGSQLVGMKYLPDNLGWEATIQLPKGGMQTSDEAIAATKRISTAYDVPVDRVVIEPSLDGMMSTARLLILTRNPLQEDQTFTGPSLDTSTGHFRLGTHADGSHALYRLYTPGSGANHGMVAGTTGAGKSALVNQLCSEIRHSGVAVLCLADPEDGESVPDWQEDGPHVFAGTLPNIRRMLQGIERIMDDRKHRRARQTWKDDKGRWRKGRGFFDPSPSDPLICVVIDEAPDVLADPECKRIVAKIGKKGRKVGVGVHVIVQVPSLTELGGDLTIRSMLSSTNVVIFRTSDKLSKQMGVPVDLPIDPANLPTVWPDGSTTAGLGYLATAGGRVSPMRANYVQDPYEWATSGRPAELPAEDEDAFADEKGNYFVQWRDLRDVDDDEEDTPPASSSPATAGAVNARPRILEFLLEQDGPVLLGVIADALSLPKPTCSMALKRMADAGEVARGSRWGTWVAVKDRELATA